MSKSYKKLISAKDPELKKKLDELYNELIKLNAQASTGTAPKSPSLINNTKKAIAQIKTLQRQREIGILSEKRTGAKKEEKNE